MTPRSSTETTTTSLTGLLSSLLVLAGVFFFINSACSKGSDVCRPGTRAPEGAAIAIVSPLEGAIITGSADAMLVPVPVALSANGVRVRESAHCEEGTGHFVIVADFDCGPLHSWSQFHPLLDGTREITLQLAPGKYTLTARFHNSDLQPIQGLVATTHIRVVSSDTAAGAAGSPACP